jgi:hypothetical protein
MPAIILSGFWMWLKPRLAKQIAKRRLRRMENGRTVQSAL